MQYRILGTASTWPALVLLFCSTFMMPASAGMLAHKNVQALAQEADTIFVGRCLAAEAGAAHFDDAGLLGHTEYRFAVEEWIKGSQPPGGSITFRQPRPLPERSLQGLAGFAARALSESREVPSYVPGQKYLLFLYPGNTWGLRSPVGLLQGSFRVETGSDGGTDAVNGIGNLGLFLDLDRELGGPGLLLSGAERQWVRQGKGPVDLQTLLLLTRTLAGRNLGR